MQDKLKEWILSMKDENGFKFSKNCKSSLLSTCFGVLALNQINYKFDDLEKEAYIKKILTYQAKNGLFIDKNLLKDYNYKGSDKNYEYLTHQMTDFAMYSLFILGNKNKLNLKFLEEYKEENKIINWLDNLKWSNPWLVSNNVMFMLNFLIYQKERLSDKKAEELIEIILEWLNKKQDSRTGFWGMDKCSNKLTGLAGAFHIIIFYYYLNKKLNFEKEIIDTTLSLQKEDGLFGFGLGGGSCEDLDAVDVLIKITKKNDYKKKEIKSALIKVHNNLINVNRNKDGGFCYNKLNKNEWRYSCFDKMKAKGNESDMWSTWFRPLTIALIENTYPELNKRNKWKFRNKPGLGWHDGN